MPIAGSNVSALQVHLGPIGLHIGRATHVPKSVIKSPDEAQMALLNGEMCYVDAAEGVAELRKRMLILPSPDWRERFKEIDTRINEEGLDNFLRWPIIHKTMFVADAPYVEEENASLSLKWKSRYYDPLIGNPPRSMVYMTTGSYIHQAYHLDIWEKTTGYNIYDMGSICELGAGYGVLRSLLGAEYKGKYTIIDHPVMNKIQKWYLEKLGMTVDFAPTPPKVDLFISIHGLSEVPLAYRPNIDAKHVLIAYIPGFDQQDNDGYFGSMGQIADGCLNTKYVMR